MSTTFSVPCKHCGNPIMITVEEGNAGGIHGVCYRCSHGVDVSYSYERGGQVKIYNVM